MTPPFCQVVKPRFTDIKAVDFDDSLGEPLRSLVRQKRSLIDL
jgi:hypothetical protein